MELTRIYNTTFDKKIGLTRLAGWYNKVEKLNLKFFKSVIETMKNNSGTIVNYFDNQATNASAESFNAKVKAFRAQFRGVRDISFFIFRLTKLFAWKQLPTRKSAWAEIKKKIGCKSSCNRSI